MSLRNAVNNTMSSNSRSCDVTRDIEMPQGPSDSISSLSFSPASNHLAVASWDNSLRIYEVASAANAAAVRGVASYEHQAPVLDVCWSRDGTKVISGGVDNAARMLDVQSGQCTQIAQHDAPIKSTRWTDLHGGLLITGSWDKTLKYWDMRQANPVGSVQLAERCYSMDVRQHLLVVATAESFVHVIDLRNLTGPGNVHDSRLVFQTRCVAVAPDATSYCIGGIEGRIYVNFTGEKPKSESYSFRCHRNVTISTTFGKGKRGDMQPSIFAVNTLAFHPYHGTCVSGGADGNFTIWDINNRKTMKSHSVKPPIASTNTLAPISAMAINYQNGGNILAYALSYDWSHGYKGNVIGHPNKVMLHELTIEEVRQKTGK